MSFHRLDRFRDTWVYCEVAKLPSGLSVDVGPVHVLDSRDREGLERILLLMIYTSPQHLLPGHKSRESMPGLRAQAVGSRTWAAYASEVRIFRIERSSYIRVFELVHAGGRYTGEKPLLCETLESAGWEKRVASCLANLRAYRFPGGSSGTMFGDGRAGWLAVAATDRDEICGEVGIKLYGDIPTEAGLEFANTAGNVFLSPPIGDWTMIVGVSLIGDQNKDSVSRLQRDLLQLARRFGRAQMFAHDRTMGYFHWMKAREGDLERCLAYLGEADVILLDFGSLTKSESALRLDKRPSSEWILEQWEIETVAGEWGVAPMQLASVAKGTCGVLASII